MAKPAKKKSTTKKAAKKPAAARSGKKPAPAAKPRTAGTGAKAAPEERAPITPYSPKPIEGIGWPAFRYPLP
jgi:hypothetical protein